MEIIKAKPNEALTVEINPEWGVNIKFVDINGTPVVGIMVVKYENRSGGDVDVIPLPKGTHDLRAIKLVVGSIEELTKTNGQGIAVEWK